MWGRTHRSVQWPAGRRAGSVPPSTVPRGIAPRPDRPRILRPDEIARPERAGPSGANWPTRGGSPRLALGRSPQEGPCGRIARQGFSGTNRPAGIARAGPLARSGDDPAPSAGDDPSGGDGTAPAAAPRPGSEGAAGTACHVGRTAAGLRRAHLGAGRAPDRARDKPAPPETAAPEAGSPTTASEDGRRDRPGGATGRSPHPSPGAALGRRIASIAP